MRTSYARGCLVVLAEKVMEKGGRGCDEVAGRMWHGGSGGVPPSAAEALF